MKKRTKLDANFYLYVLFFSLLNGTEPPLSSQSHVSPPCWSSPRASLSKRDTGPTHPHCGIDPIDHTLRSNTADLKKYIYKHWVSGLENLPTPLYFSVRLRERESLGELVKGTYRFLWGFFFSFSHKLQSVSPDPLMSAVNVRFATHQSK